MKNIKDILPITRPKKRKFNINIFINMGILTLTSALITIAILIGNTTSPTGMSTAGYLLIITILLKIFYHDTLLHDAEIIQDRKMLILAALILSGNFIFAKGLYFILEGPLMWLGNVRVPVVAYIIPLSISSLLFALLFDTHMAVVSTVITSFLVGLWFNDPVFCIYTFIGGITATFSVTHCKRRTCLLKAGVIIGEVLVLSSIMISLIAGRLLSIETLILMIHTFVNGLIVAIMVSGILPLLENSFGVTTNISLLEWLDLNHPLMKNLMVEAPGTYHHSIIVGSLVEAAAEAVGVNPLQARVGAYYHDIGKLKMSEYFIENQHSISNRHEKLTPSMSSLILIGHVKEGVELARKYRLPKEIREIIQQHHGASLITFFYEKAKDLSKNNGGHVVDKDNFRYPGPKPQTRVAALVMLADNVEAAARVLDNPTPARIETLIDTIINKIFLDGQLDDCELTLKDLNKIKSHFTYILTGIHHKRIDYPGFEIRTDDHLHNQPAEASKTRLPKDRTTSQKYSSFLKPIKG
jgi:putative nucleotidyltransferase with HDIG domain